MSQEGKTAALTAVTQLLGKTGQTQTEDIKALQQRAIKLLQEMIKSGNATPEDFATVFAVLPPIFQQGLALTPATTVHYTPPPAPLSTITTSHTEAKIHDGETVPQFRQPLTNTTVNQKQLEEILAKLNNDLGLNIKAGDNLCQPVMLSNSNSQTTYYTT